MTKRFLSWIIAFAMTLTLMPLSIPVFAAEQKELAEPSSGEYRFNGHWVTDRSKFRQNLDDWALITYSDNSAVLTSGATAGEGMDYSDELGSKWYGRIRVSLSDQDEAGIGLGGEKPLKLMLTRSSGTTNLSVVFGENSIYEGTLGSAGDISIILDNMEEGESLKLFFYSGDTYLKGVELSSLDSDIKSVLKAVNTVGFYATKAGTTFTGFAINNMVYKYTDDPAAALAKVEEMARTEVEGSIVNATNGVPMYTPDGVQSYNALWTRDFSYIFEYAGDYVPLENAVACMEYLLEHVHEGDCWVPDRVEGNGNPVYAAGAWPYSYRNLDNNSFIAIVLDNVLDKMDETEGKALFEKWESTILTALESLPKDDKGLVYNDPANPHSPYGFTDCIAKTGSLMIESLLLWRAYSDMAKWQAVYGKDSSAAEAAAKKIEDSLVSTFKNGDGMLNAATADCCQTDIWGSCYAVSIGFPLEDSLKKSIADYLAENYDGLVQIGQVRHTAPGTYWEKLLSGVGQGEYQNGAYWGTAAGWLIDALYEYYPDLAMVTLEDVITYYEDIGIYECVNGESRKLNHYTASATNILRAARKLLTPSIESITINGDAEAATGARKEYSLTVEPAEAEIVSYQWTMDGEEAGSKENVTVTFEAAGEHILKCVVTDLAGKTAEAELTVNVTDGTYDGITITVEPVIGRKGDIVTVSYKVSEGSMLAFADIEINYDPAVMEPAGDRFGISAGELWDGVLAGNKAKEGTLIVSMATGRPVEKEGEILKVTFRLLATLEEPTYVKPDFKKAKVDELDDSGAHEVEVAVVEGELPLYIFTKGADGTWSGDAETGEPYEFQVKRTDDDAVTFSHFRELKMDGTVIEPSNYTAVSGSLNGSLKPAYMATLSEGKHTLSVVFDDAEIETTITVDNEVPATGDASGTNMFLFMMLGSLLGIIAMLYRRKIGQK